MRMILAAALLASAPALAADAGHQMTVKQAADLLAGLTAISNGHPCADTPPAANAQPQLCQYHLSGPTQLALGRNIAQLKAVVTEAQDAQQRAARGILAGSEKPTAEQSRQIEAETQKVLDQPVSFTPVMITLGDLKLGDDAKSSNQISPGVLALVAPVISDWDKQ